ncbi:MAG: GNAT family N-acetyltransferase [bacterium]|nr:GNAT family N-acetyltransferase [bacterium]
MTIRVTRKATEKDLSIIETLLEENDLSISGVGGFLEDFLVLEEGNETIGCGGFEIYAETALLRSVAVKRSSHKKGLGTVIVKELFKYAESRNVKRIFLLTMTAPDFFSRFGFKQIERDEADDAIKTTEEFTTICPASAVVMVKEMV